MKALVYDAPGNVTVRELAKPAATQGEALVRVAFAGICGSDLSIVAGKHPRAKPPLVPGHEFSGVIESVGDNAEGFKARDRITAYPLIPCGTCHACSTGNAHVCRTLKLLGIDRVGAMAEYVSVPIYMLFHVPDEVPDDIAALIEPVAVCVHTIRESALKFHDKVMVTGAGPIGLLTAILLRDAGISELYVSEIDPFRLSEASRLGFEAIDLRTTDPIQYVREKTGGEGVDVLFEASGSAPAAMQMTELVRPRGQIVMLSVHKDPHPVDLRQVNFKELDIIGTRVYRREDYDVALACASRMQGVLRGVITNVVPLSDAGQAFELIHDPGVNTLKVMIDCG